MCIGSADLGHEHSQELLDQVGQVLILIFGLRIEKSWLSPPLSAATIPYSASCPRKALIVPVRCNHSAKRSPTAGVPHRELTRVRQISRVQTEWIDNEARTITWPKEVMKANREHTIPYSDTVAAIFETLPKHGFLFPARGRDTPFNGFSNSKRAFDKRLDGMEPYTLHDLRRSVASGWQRMGVRIEVTETLLAHRSGSFRGIVSVYQRHNYQPELRDALEEWERHLAALLRSA